MSDLTPKICAYVMTKDSGFAPNPFYGWCTLAACTPNHMNARLHNGDIIAGFFHKAGDFFLVYALEISEILDHDAYYRDARFKRKRPSYQRGKWRDCANNIYFRSVDGLWTQAPAATHHVGEKWLARDTKYPRVFLGTKFRYFGDEAFRHRLPASLHSVVPGGMRGVKYTRRGKNARTYQAFMDWLSKKPLGRHGDPRDRNEGGACNRPPLTPCRREPGRR